MPSPTTTIVGIRELDCSAEEQLLRRVLGSLPGVTSLTFDIVNRRLTIEHDAELIGTQAIAAKIKSAGMTPALAGASNLTNSPDGDGSCGSEVCKTPSPAAEVEPVATRRELVMLGISAVLAAGSEITAWTTGQEQSWAVISMAVVAILLGGLPTLRKGFIAVKTLTLNINFLMTVAVIGACIIGSWPEAAMVVVLFAIAELIEKFSLDRARNAIRALMDVAPPTAWVKQAGENGFIEVPVGEVAVGSIIRIRPGERLPLDGIVLTGASAVNQAPITGESVPVDKKVGDEVFAGTINEDGLLEVRTTGGQDQTTIARIIRTVQEAQGQRAPTQRFVDRFARIYTPAVFVFALLV
ncbi:MAG: heavy metal translocating P-type ATPase, partial [Fimbriimonadaceae bacterium]|nr:heavy metal translocating P-type ATPase [Fimbriimonadaceae bacterium]